MITIAEYIGSIIITAVLTSLVVTFLTPVKQLVYNKLEERCAFEKDKTGNPGLKEIVVIKKFGKTTHINCYWFDKREEKELDGIKYSHCFYGQKFLSANGKGGAKCPFA